MEEWYMPTIKDIAKACDVSVATVSNIINHKSNVSEETRQRVLGVIEEMNYMPNSVAKNLKMKQTRSIGVIAEDMTVFALPDIIDGITEYCEQEEYQILLTNLRLYKKFGDRYYSDSSYKTLVHKEIRRLQAKQVDGIIYIGAHERLITVLPGDLDIPAVVAYGYTDNPAIPSVVVRDESGARMLTQYLLEKGHRKIGVIAGKKDSIHTQSRLEGFQKALFEQGVLYDPNLVMYGDWERECGYRYTDEQIAEAIRRCHAETGYLLDPHGACGYQALKAALRPGETGVFLETAHPAKFKGTVDQILGADIEIPAKLRAFMAGQKQSIELSKDFEGFKRFLLVQ